MRKRFSRVKANVKHSHSVSMMKGLLLSLLQYGSITTTVSKAKLLKNYADSEIAYALKEEFSNPEIQIESHAKNSLLAKQLMLYRKFAIDGRKQRKGSYTSVVNAGYRSGDNARVIEVLLIDAKEFSEFISAIKPRKKVEKKQKKPAHLSARSMKEKERKMQKTQKVLDNASKKEKVNVMAKRKRIASKKIVNNEKKAPTSVPPVERKAGFFARLGDRILGRRVQGPSQKGRSTARSGL